MAPYIRSLPVPERRRRLRAASIFAVVLLVAACGSTTTPKPSQPGYSSAPSISGSPAAPVHLPAGVQYDPKPENPPATSDWGGTLAYSVDGSKRVMMGVRLGGAEQVRAAVSTASGQWQDVLVDTEKGISDPAGFPIRYPGSVAATAIAAGSSGFVAVGSAEFWGGNIATKVALGWFSADGTTWQRIDLARTVGSGHSFDPASVIATGSGFVAIGDISDTGLNANGAIAIVTSPDGINWHLASTVKGTWTLSAGRIAQLGKTLVIDGTEAACDTGGTNQVIFNAGNQYRIWTSTDGGATWIPGDSTAGGIITSLKPMPTAKKDCTTTDIMQLDRDYATSGGLVGIVGGRAVFTSGSGKVATTSDLKDFTTSTLPGFATAGGSAAYSSGSPAASALVPDGSGMAILSLGPRLDSSGAVSGVGSQVQAWTSADGSTWKQLPLARPILLRDYANLDLAPDGSVVLVDGTLLDPNTGGRQSRLLHSVAGLLAPWGTCQPGKGADCSFSTITKGTAGLDLSGADFTGATVQSDLTGSRLTNAQLSSATVPGSVFSASDLTGADLTRATVIIKVGDKSLENHDFGTLDLTRVAFNSDTPHVKADLQGADFTRATISNTSFGAVDLTGAKFPTTSTTTADFPLANFYANDTVCPDGKAPTVGIPGIAACRVGPKPSAP
jgi:hypothetical protein